MIGIVYIIFFYLYWRISKWAVNNTITWAAHTGRSYKLWGLIAAFVMYNLVFWDLIPTYATHQYYCMKDAGFTQHKSIDEWKVENPDVVKQLVSNENHNTILEGNKRRYVLNQRFAWDNYYTKHLFNIMESNKQIVDMKTGDVLAEYIDFDSNIKAFGLGQRNFRDFKIWLMINSCESGKRTERKKFYNFELFIKNLGSKN